MSNREGERAVREGERVNHRRTWRAWEDEKLRSGFRAGEPDARLAVLLGRSEHAVQVRRQALGLLRGEAVRWR